MGLSFRTFIPSEMEALIDFIVVDSYPFNANPHPTRQQVASWIDSGLYSETFWIIDDERGPVGAMHYQDASAITAEVHIRLHTPYRGQGIGSQAIEWLTTYLFHRFPEKHRVEGWTRFDNLPMRKVFQRCRYAKEAHLRQDFPTETGTYVDKIGYAILRGDWRKQSVTPVGWHDEGQYYSGHIA
jgi:RimJ/RimL family protein N-acetyltransferase